MTVKLSMPLFDGEPALDADALVRAFDALRGANERRIDVTADDRTLSFRLDGLDVVVGVMAASIPWTDLEAPCASTRLWPNAAEAVRTHRWHALVCVGGDAAPVELMTTLTRATCIVLGAAPSALGVFWPSASLLVSKALFVNFAQKMLPEHLPLELWISIQVARNADGTTRGFSEGLAAFDLPDFESLAATDPPIELRDRLMSLGSYLIENGDVIHDGHTVGADEHEHVRVVEADSSFGLERRVLRLIYETAGADGPH